MSKKTKKNIVVYTDGSCSGNGTKTALGGIGIHFPNGELKDISKVFRMESCTNQRTELYAILSAIRYIKQRLGLSDYKVIIMTDSEYSINCITKWVYGWIKNGWRTKNNTPVSNREFIEVLHKYYETYDIELHHVDAHTGMDDDESVANAKADVLATRATKKAQLERDSTSKSFGSKSRRKSETGYSSQSKYSGKHSEAEHSPPPPRSSYGGRNKRGGGGRYGPRYEDEIIVELIKSGKSPSK